MANDIEEMIVEEGLNGTKRIIAHLGMRNYKIDITKDREPIILKESKWLRAPNSGMFQALVKNGAFVEKGIKGDTDEYAVIEMGGTGVGGMPTRATETSVRGFWKYYRELLNV